MLRIWVHQSKDKKNIVVSLVDHGWKQPDGTYFTESLKILKWAPFLEKRVQRAKAKLTRRWKRLVAMKCKI